MKKYSLLEGSILKGLLYFSIPLFFSYLFQQLYNVVDTLLIGHYLGDLSLAAIGSTTAIFDLTVGFSNGVGLGFGIVIARYYGSKDSQKIKNSVASSIVLTIIFSLSLSLLSYIGLPYLLHFLNTPASIYSDALSYIRFITSFLLVTMSYNLMIGMFRAIGDSFTPLIILFVSSCLNIFLDIFCITVLKLGIFGAALATIVSQFIAAIFCAYIMYKKAKILIPSKSNFVYDQDLIADLSGQGFSMGFMLSIVSLGTVTLQYAINSLGAVTIVAHTAARKLFSLFNIPLSSISASLSTFVSQNKGANQYDRIKKGIRLSCKLGMGYVCILTVVMFLASKQFIVLLTNTTDSTVIHNGSLYLLINTPCMMILTFLINFRNSLQGLGKKIVPLISSIIELVGKIIFTLILIPMLHYFGVILCEPIIWLAMTIQLYFSLKI